MLLKPINYKAPIYVHTQTITATPSYINSNVQSFADTPTHTSRDFNSKIHEVQPDYKI